MDLEVEGFTPLEVVGRGGSATVYRARQDAFDREVALKVFDVEFGDLERERFVRELRAVGRLGEVHHAVALVFATGVTAHNRPYIAMRYYPGGSLQAAVKRSGPVSVEDALVVAECVGGALDAAHGVGILHRDVKPANVLLDGRQLAVLADFGVAGFVEAAGDTSGSVPMMTPAYAAPERFEGESATVASDVYSFAATLWSILAGHVPHATTTGDSISTIMHRILKGEIQALDRTDVPPHIELALRRALERDPAVRPSTAGELVAELAVGMGPSAAVAPRSSLLVVPSAMDTSAEIDTPESLDEQTRIRPSGIAGGIPPMPSPPDEATGVSPLAAPSDGAQQSVLAVGVGERSAEDVSGEPSSRRRVLLVAAALFGVLLAVGVVVSLAVRDNGDGKVAVRGATEERPARTTKGSNKSTDPSITAAPVDAGLDAQSPGDVAEGPTSVPGAATASIGGVGASSTGGNVPGPAAAAGVTGRSDSSPANSGGMAAPQQPASGGPTSPTPQPTAPQVPTPTTSKPDSINCASGGAAVTFGPGLGWTSARQWVTLVEGKSGLSGCTSPTSSSTTATFDGFVLEFGGMNCLVVGGVGEGDGTVHWSDGSASTSTLRLVFDHSDSGYPMGWATWTFKTGFLAGRTYYSWIKLDFADRGLCATAVTRGTITFGPFAPKS